MSYVECPSCRLRVAGASAPACCPRCLIRHRGRFYMAPVTIVTEPARRDGAADSRRYA